MERFRRRFLLEVNIGDLGGEFLVAFTGVSRDGKSSGSTKQTVLDDPSPRFFLGVTRTGVRPWLERPEEAGEVLTGLRIAGDCINFTETLLGVLTGVLKVFLITGLSLLGVFRIDLAFRPDFGVGGCGFMLK